MIAAYARALAAVIATMTGSIQPLVLLYTSGDQSPASKRAFAEAVLPIIAQGRQSAHREAVRFIRRQAAAALMSVPDHLLPEAPGGITAGSIEALLYRSDSADAGSMAKAIVRNLGSVVRAPARELAESLADVAPDQDDLVFQDDSDEDFSFDLEEQIIGEREAVVRRKLRRPGSKRTEVPRRRWRFARVLTGKDDCAFCVMLASAGAVYSSAKRAAGSEYHPGCDCLAVLVFTDRLDPKAQADADKMRVIWRAAQAEVEGVEGTKNDSLNRLRRYMREHRPVIPHSVMT